MKLSELIPILVATLEQDGDADIISECDSEGIGAPVGDGAWSCRVSRTPTEVIFHVGRTTSVTRRKVAD